MSSPRALPTSGKACPRCLTTLSLQVYTYWNQSSLQLAALEGMRKAVADDPNKAVSMLADPAGWQGTLRRFYLHSPPFDLHLTST